MMRERDAGEPISRSRARGVRRTVQRIVRSFFPLPYLLRPYASPTLRTQGKTAECQNKKSSFASPILRTTGATCSKLLFSFPYLTYNLFPYVQKNGTYIAGMP